MSVFLVRRDGAPEIHELAEGTFRYAYKQLHASDCMCFLSISRVGWVGVRFFDRYI